MNNDFTAFILGTIVGGGFAIFILAGFISENPTLQTKDPLVATYKGHIYKLIEIKP